MSATDHADALDALFGWIDRQLGPQAIAAIGHRIVHGGRLYRTHSKVDDALLDELERIEAYALSICLRDRNDEVVPRTLRDLAANRLFRHRIPPRHALVAACCRSSPPSRAGCPALWLSWLSYRLPVARTYIVSQAKSPPKGRWCSPIWATAQPGSRLTGP